MSFPGGLTEAQRDAELLSKDAEAEQDRLPADTAARNRRAGTLGTVVEEANF